MLLTNNDRALIVEYVLQPLQSTNTVALVGNDCRLSHRRIIHLVILFTLGNGLYEMLFE